MVHSLDFINNWRSKNPLDRPQEYLLQLPYSIAKLVSKELKQIVENPYKEDRTHDLRDPWEGFMGWYPDHNSKLKNYRIIYKVDIKVRIYRIGHHSIVYKK